MWCPNSYFISVPMHLFALGISESIMFPWTQAEETEETAAENDGSSGASSMAWRHSIQAYLFSLSSMMETSVETRGGVGLFINSRVKSCHTNESCIHSVKLPCITLSAAWEWHYSRPFPRLPFAWNPILSPYPVLRESTDCHSNRRLPSPSQSTALSSPNGVRKW